MNRMWCVWCGHMCVVWERRRIWRLLLKSYKTQVWAGRCASVLLRSGVTLSPWSAACTLSSHRSGTASAAWWPSSSRHKEKLKFRIQFETDSYKILLVLSQNVEKINLKFEILVFLCQTKSHGGIRLHCLSSAIATHQRHGIVSIVSIFRLPSHGMMRLRLMMILMLNVCKFGDFVVTFGYLLVFVNFGSLRRRRAHRGC